MMTPQSAASLALWLAKEQPQIFIALAQRAGVDLPTPQLGSFASIMGAVGSGLSNVAKSVGSFLTSSQGLQTLTGLGATYLTVKAQKDAMKLQVAQAQAGQPAAPIETQYNANTGAYETVYTTANGQRVPLTASNVNAYMPYASEKLGWTQSPWLPLAIGGGVLILFFLFKRR